jgi:hypothetical protein
MCKTSPEGRNSPVQVAATVPVVSVPSNAMSLRRTVNVASFKRSGSAPQLALRTSQGWQCRTKRWAVASHDMLTVPTRVGWLRPLSCCAIQGVVPH